MANLKISQLTAGAPAQSGDLFPIARAGANFSLLGSDIVTLAGATLAPKASPTFTGTPAAPTAAVNTNTTQLATTAFVIGQGYGVGTVTTVGFTGGLISVATQTTTPAFTVAGTSGGIPYFSSTSAWASSALLTLNSPVLGGGAGAAPLTATFLTTDGAAKLTVGIAGGGNGALALAGTTSGTATFTAPAVAGTTSNGVISSNVLGLPNGSNTAPAYSFSNAPGTGMYLVATNTLAFVLSSSNFVAGNFNGGNGFCLNSGTILGWLASGGTGVTGDTTLARASAKVINIGVGGDSTGAIQLNRVNKAGVDMAGQVTITAAATTQAVSYAANYTSTAAPIVVMTPTSDPLAVGVPVGYWITPTGGAGAWTGFTANIQTALAGNVTFNYIVIGPAA